MWGKFAATHRSRDTDGQDAKWRRNIAENFKRLSKAHERYSQTTGDSM